MTRLVLTSVQLAFARQGAKEQAESDDDLRRSDDSYSPRRARRLDRELSRSDPHAEERTVDERNQDQGKAGAREVV
jgi:hypothetical protein